MELVISASAFPGSLLVGTNDVIDDVAAMKLGFHDLEVEVLIIVERWHILFLKWHLFEISGLELLLFTSTTGSTLFLPGLIVTYIL
jgi:hypothetical protein